MKRRRRKWKHSPAPWRPRISELARLVDETQRNIEISIGFRRLYSQQVSVVVSEIDPKKLSLLCYLLNATTEDAKGGWKFRKYPRMFGTQFYCAISALRTEPFRKVPAK